MEISVKSTIGFKLACTTSPSLAERRRAMHLPHASYILAPYCRGMSTPFPVLVSA